MICEDLYCGRGTQEIMSPSVKGSHDGKQLMIIYIIVAFGRAECLR